MYDLKDKTVLITGAANGIGAAIATEILKEGAKHVRMLDINENAGISLRNVLNDKYGQNKAKFVKCDVTDDECFFKAIEDTKTEEGYLDLMINNAGVANEINYAAIRKLIEINYIALVNGTLKAKELMDVSKGGRGGTVINVSSIAGLLPLAPPLYTYSSSKSAVLQFTECIGHELFYSKTGVRVIAVCFGATDTPIFNSFVSFGSENLSFFDDYFSKNDKQSAESAAKGTVEAYKKGKSSSTWLIANDNPALDISDTRAHSHEKMAKLMGA